MPHAASPSRHATGLAITAGVHVLLGAALLSLGVVHIGPTPPDPIRIIRVKTPPAPPPDQPVIRDDVEAPRVDAPIIVIETPDVPKAKWVAPDLPALPPIGPSDGGGTATTVVDPTPPAPVFVDARLDKRFAARFQPPYPASAQRMEQEGVVLLRVLVAADGRVARAEVKSSSGHATLDESAIRHALRAWRFLPATRDGVGVETWREIPVRFELKAG